MKVISKLLYSMGHCIKRYNKTNVIKSDVRFSQEINTNREEANVINRAFLFRSDNFSSHRSMQPVSVTTFKSKILR